MAVSYVYTPEDILYSKNPIVVTVNTTNGVGTRMDCYLTDVTNSTNIGSVLCYADSVGNYQFKLNHLIDSYLNRFDVPEDPAAVWDNTLLKLQRTAINIMISCEEATGETAGLIYKRVIKGGLDKNSYMREPRYWTNYFASNKTLISWLPEYVKVGKTQPLFFTYNNYNTVTDGKLKIRAYFTDGTNATVLKDITDPIEEDTFYLVKSGYSQLDVGAIDAGKVVHYYEVWLVDDSGAALCGSRKILVAHKHELYERFFMYMGSSGNIEVIRTTGKAQYKPEINSLFVDREDQIEIDTEANLVNYTVPFTSNEYDLQKRRSIKVFSGAKTTYEVQLFEDFRVAPWKAEFIPGIGIVPITIDDRSPDLGKDGDPSPSYSFTYKYTNSEKVFTPLKITKALGL